MTTTNLGGASRVPTLPPSANVTEAGIQSTPVDQTRVDNISDNTEVPPTKLDTLELELLARILDYFPLRDVQEVSLTNKAVQAASKKTISDKLMRAGVEGETFETLTHNAMQFSRDVNAIHKKHNQLRDFTMNLQIQAYVQGTSASHAEVSYLPLRDQDLSLDTDEKLYSFPIRNALDSPQLLERCEISPTPEIKGLNLNKGSIYFRVPVKAHVENLQWQLAKLTQGQDSSEVNEKEANNIKTIISKLESLAQKGNATAKVAYIPIVDSTAPHPNLYEDIFDDSQGALSDQFARKINGFGANSESITVGIDVANTDILLSAPPKDIRTAIVKTNQTMSEFVDRNVEKVLNLV